MSWVSVMLCSSTVRLPSLSRPALCVQEVVTATDDDSSSGASALLCAAESSVMTTIMSCNDASITELLPR